MYTCPYRHCCPTGGLSTEFAFAGIPRLYEELVDHWEARDELNELLEKMRGYTKSWKTKTLSSRPSNRCIDAISRPIAKPPAGSPSVPANPKTRCPQGHPGWHLPTDHIDRHTPLPHRMSVPCQSTDLTPIAETKEHLQEDIMLSARTHVTCLSTAGLLRKLPPAASYRPAEGTMLNCPIGPKTKLWRSFYAMACGWPYRKVKELFHVLFGMRLCRPSAMGLTAP